MNITESLYAAIEKGREGKSQGYSIGLPKLEEVIDGVTKGTYFLLGGESGTGKSRLALYSFVYRPLMEHLDDKKFKVTFFSLEMNPDMILCILLSMYLYEKYEIRLSVKQILSIKRNYILDDKNYNIIKECRPWLDKVEQIIEIYDKNNNADSIYATLMTSLEKDGVFKETDKRKIYIPNDPELIHVVIVDHLGRIFPTNGRSLKEEMDRTSKYLYSLKNRTGISPVIIQQLNRSIQSMDRRRENMMCPQTSDFKDSNCSIEDAEVVLAIFSPNKAKMSSYRGYDIKTLKSHFSTLTVLKSRYGESDVEDALFFDGKCNMWSELPKSDEIVDYNYLLLPLQEKEERDTIEVGKDTSNFSFKL